MSVVTLPLADVLAATPRSRLLVLDLGNRPFDFLPGQAVLLAAHGSIDQRPYSIACSPERVAETGRIELLVALEADGSIGPLPAAAAGGDLVDVAGPLGTFVFPASAVEPSVLFVAGGAGISPLRAMLDHVLRQRQERQLSVLYSARTSDEFAFAEELRAHAADGRIALHQTVTRDDRAGWSGGRGRIGRSHFELAVHDPERTLCFVCGPRPMVTESVAVLQALGVPARAIRTEGWGESSD